MQLNDNATDAERQRLVPYVTRLACADTPAIEAKRAAFIKSRNVPAYSFERGLKLLEEALAIGRQANTLALDTVRIRMHDVQARARSANSVADSPVFGKVKSWF